MFEIQRGVMETNWQTSPRHFFASKQFTASGNDFISFPHLEGAQVSVVQRLGPNVSGVVKLEQDKISSNESNLSSLDTLLD